MLSSVTTPTGRVMLRGAAGPSRWPNLREHLHSGKKDRTLAATQTAVVAAEGPSKDLDSLSTILKGSTHPWQRTSTTGRASLVGRVPHAPRQPGERKRRSRASTGRRSQPVRTGGRTTCGAGRGGGRCPTGAWRAVRGSARAEERSWKPRTYTIGIGRDTAPRGSSPGNGDDHIRTRS